MTKMPIITALLKRNLFFSELIRLLQEEGIKVSVKKDIDKSKAPLEKALEDRGLPKEKD